MYISLLAFLQFSNERLHGINAPKLVIFKVGIVSLIIHGAFQRSELPSVVETIHTKTLEHKQESHLLTACHRHLVGTVDFLRRCLGMSLDLPPHNCRLFLNRVFQRSRSTNEMLFET